MIPLTIKKDELLKMLEALRPFAEKSDKDSIAKHKKAEQEYLLKFRKACRDAAKWTYEQAKKNGFKAAVQNETPGSYRDYEPSPHCPSSRVVELERIIAMVKRNGVERYNIRNSGKYNYIYKVLAWNAPEQKGLC